MLGFILVIIYSFVISINMAIAAINIAAINIAVINEDKNQALNPSSILKIILEKNFDIIISDYNTKEKEGDLKKSYGEFDTNLKYSYVLDKNDIPSSSSLDGAGNTSSVITENSTHTLRVTKTLQNGIKFDVPYIYKSVYSNSSYRTIQTSYEPSLGVVLTFPIIKIFSDQYFSKNIKNKELELEIALKKHSEKIIEVFSDTIDLYFDIVESIKSLEITKIALENSKENYLFALEKDKVGRISMIDLLDAESAVKSNEDELLKKENDTLNKTEKLSLNIWGEITKINLPIYNNFENTALISSSLSSEEDVLKTAFEKRIEISKTKEARNQAQMKFDSSKIDLYPTLDLQPEITLRGMNSKGSDANEDIIEKKYTSWKVGLTIERKWNQYAAVAANRMDELKLLQEKIKEEQAKKDITLEVKQALRDISSLEKRLLSLKMALKAQNEKYKALNAKFKMGVVSMFDLNEAYKGKMQSDLDLLKAYIEYRKKLISLFKAKGTLIEELLTNKNTILN
ncbi:MAG: TolC family protein [Oligoflexia bacterium]|nr:TolC family protein [Oligoflexia bacterium]